MYASLPTRVHDLDTQVPSFSISERSHARYYTQDLELSLLGTMGGRNCNDHQVRLRLLPIRGNKWSAETYRKCTSSGGMRERS